MKKLSIIAVLSLISSAFASENLGEIIVTSASKEPQKIKEITQSVTVITKEEIEEKGYQSIPEILSHIPGFNASYYGGYGQPISVFVRGLSSENLLVLLNGIPLTDYTQPSASGALEQIPIDLVEKIEVIKGGQSGIWGASAAAGTINIITKDGNINKSSLFVKYGSYATKNIGIDFARKFNKHNIALGLAWLDTHSFSAMAPKNAENDGYKYITSYFKGNFQINNFNSLELFWHYGNNKYDYDGFNANDKNSNGKRKENIYSISHHFAKGALTIDTKLSYVKMERKYLNKKKQTGNYIGKNTLFSITANYKFSNKNSITFGGEFNKNKAISNSIYTGYEKATLKNYAAFAFYTHTIDSILGADTTFNLALRYDNFNKFKNKFTYRFGIKRECNAIEGLHSAFNIYTGYKAPSIYQFLHAPNGLKPESLKGYDITIGYKNYINLTYFHEKIKDKIYSVYYPKLYKSDFFNGTKSIKREGIELQTQYAFNNGFVIGANWTHLFNFKDTKGKIAQKVPQNTASLFIDYYFNETTHIGLSANYVGKRKDKDYLTYPIQEVTLKSYTTFDLTYNTTIKNNLKFSFTIKNIFDKKYETVKNYSVEGRSIYAKLEYKF